MVEITGEELNIGAKIIVVGVGGAGNNVINRMIDDGITGVEYICVNTDSQQLKKCKSQNIIQIGEKLTGGRGAGGNPEIGRNSAEESREQITEAIKDCEMLFVTCGMGGGTGTGAAPVIAQIAKDLGKLTVGIVTKPFGNEANVRTSQAEQGIAALREHVDSIIVIPNDNLRKLCDKKAKTPDVYKMADTVLRQGVQGITDMINNEGDINVDFADVCSVMRDKGVAHLGIGRATGDDACMKAIQEAIQSPLLETEIDGAENLLVHFKGDLIFDDMSNACDYIKDIVGSDTNIIRGEKYDESEPDTVYVTIIATGIKNPNDPVLAQPQKAVNPQRPGLAFLGIENNNMARKTPVNPAQGMSQGARPNPAGYKPTSPMGTKPANAPAGAPVRKGLVNGVKPNQPNQPGSGNNGDGSGIQIADFLYK